MTCVYQKTLSLILLSTTAHNQKPFLIASGSNFSPVLLLDVRIVALFCKDGPVN